MYSVYMRYLIYMEAVKSKQVKLKSYTIICHRQISVTFYTWENFSVLRFLLSLLSLNLRLISLVV